MEIDINIIAIEAVLTSTFLILHKSFISQKLVVIISPEYSIPIRMAYSWILPTLNV